MVVGVVVVDIVMIGEVVMAPVQRWRCWLADTVAGVGSWRCGVAATASMAALDASGRGRPAVDAVAALHVTVAPPIVKADRRGKLGLLAEAASPAKVLMSEDGLPDVLVLLPGAGSEIPAWLHRTSSGNPAFLSMQPSLPC